MKAEIISIGTEITTGSTLNTNSQYLADGLLELGIEALYHTAVDDNVERLREVIKIALGRVDFIITTGGLGPTDDDMTKEIFAETLNVNLIEDADMIEIIKEKLNSYKKIPSNNLKQAIKLEGSYFLKNHVGTAPGILLYKDKKTIILLPGPPREMKTMFDNEVAKHIHKDFHIIRKSINIVGIGESLIEMKIKDLLNRYDNISIATFAKPAQVEIKIIGRCKNLEKQFIEEKIDDIVLELKKRFRENIYSFDNDPIEVTVFKMLKANKYKIGFCESCTGGLVSGKFSRIPGVSQVLDRSIVTYSNNSKMEEVNVSPETLKSFGAVSEEVALEMAKGMLEHGELDLAVSITGIASPLMNDQIKPTGLVYICVATKDRYKVSKFNFTGDREFIQDRTVFQSFIEIRNFLLN